MRHCYSINRGVAGKIKTGTGAAALAADEGANHCIVRKGQSLLEGRMFGNDCHISFD
jgi:hypothetical protein